MLTINIGGFFSDAHANTVAKIKERTELGKRSFLIVPEQQTVSTEREFIDLLPPSASLCFEATNFTRFANTVFRSLGGLSGRTLDSGKRLLIMWRTLSELAPFLDMTKSSDINAGLVTDALVALKEIGSLGLSPQDIQDAADRLGNSGADERLRAKLKDLSKIGALYKSILSEHYQDSDDDLSLLEGIILKSGEELFSNCEIFIEGFTSFTEPQYKVIAALLRYAPITVSLALPPEEKKCFEYTELSAARDRLSTLAAQVGSGVRLNKFVSDDGQDSLLRQICAKIWRTNSAVDNKYLQNIDSLRIFAADTPYDECDFIAADIKKKVIEGARYSDFAVIARSIDSYGSMLKVAFDKAGIPIFLSQRQDVSSYEVIKLIYLAFSAVTGGYSGNDVIAYSKCSLSGLERELADEFELYCQVWGINGRRFTDGDMWNMNPDGYSEKRSRSCGEKLLRIDRARRALIEPLMRLEADLSGNTAISHARALFAFMQELRLEEKLIHRAMWQRASGDKDGAADTEKLYRTICDSLDDICEILGDIEISPTVFLNLLKIVFSESDIGRIPSYTDKVTAGSADSLRVYKKKHIYIIGLSFGVFPAAGGSEGFLTDKDRERLGLAGLNLPQESAMRSARELYYFIRALSYAGESATLLYPLRNEVFKPTLPSEAITRISAVTGDRISAVKISSLPSMERTYNPEYALENFGRDKDNAEAIRLALCEAGFAERLSMTEGNIRNTGLSLSKETSDLLYGSTMPLSQSRIDKFVGCPMSYFCTYNLSLAPEKRAELDAGNIGTFIHSVLENFLKRARECGKKIGDMPDSERNEIITAVAKRYIEANFEGVDRRGARCDAQIDRLRRSARPIVDSLCAEFSNSEFEPLFFELEIDRKSPDTPTPAIFKTSDGREIYIRGYIDRVDAMVKGDDAYIRVVDYKTGTKIFSPKDIEQGKNLQMFLYLKSIVDTESEEFKSRIGIPSSGKLIPAGVIYLKADIGDAKIKSPDESIARAAVAENQKRIGMVLDDEVSLSGMNPDYLPFTLDTKSSKPNSRNANKLYTRSGWDSICDTISTVMQSIGDRMTSGDISASPLETGKSITTCKYCDFKSVCRNAKV